MQSDLPHTLFSHEDADAKPRVRADDPAFKMQQEAAEKALARREAKLAEQKLKQK